MTFSEFLNNTKAFFQTLCDILLIIMKFFFSIAKEIIKFLKIIIGDNKLLRITGIVIIAIVGLIGLPIISERSTFSDDFKNLMTGGIIIAAVIGAIAVGSRR